jgi:5-methylcytosine-specific restriction endonuclease McrA
VTIRCEHFDVRRVEGESRLGLVEWDRPHFKSEEPSRVDRAKQKKADADAAWLAVCRAVDARDGKQCRCCDKRSDPEATGLLKRGHRHHIVYRSAGGTDTTENLVTLCAMCHNDEHKHRLMVVGNADVALTFHRQAADGLRYISREELAVRVVRRD